MNDRMFTVDEARACLFRLEEAYERILGLARRVRQARTEALDLGAANPLARVLAESQVRFLREEIAGVLREAGSTGGVVRDLERGYVDFPIEVEGRGLAHLCWRVDDGGIVCWHGLSEPHSARRPIPRTEVLR